MTQPLRHSAEDFWGIFGTSTCAVGRRRALFFALFAEQRPQSEVLPLSRYSRVTAYHLLNRYRELGLAALQDGRHSNRGAPTLLIPAEQHRLAARLHKDFEQGIVWEDKQVQAWIKQEFGKAAYLGRAYEFMRAAGFSPQESRP